MSVALPSPHRSFAPRGRSRPALRLAATREVEAASDEELLVATGRGDRDAFSVLYDRTVPTVRGVARRVLRDAALADEVCQEVMVEVWRTSPRFDPDRGSARGWLATLAHRRAVDRVRSEQASRDRAARAAARDVERPFDVVADEVEVRLEHWQVRAALAALSDRQREAVELAYYAGHTYRDVAEVLGIPEGTAKSRLRDGLARLRRTLEDLEAPHR